MRNIQNYCNPLWAGFKRVHVGWSIHLTIQKRTAPGMQHWSDSIQSTSGNSTPYGIYTGPTQTVLPSLPLPNTHRKDQEKHFTSGLLPNSKARRCRPSYCRQLKKHWKGWCIFRIIEFSTYRGSPYYRIHNNCAPQCTSYHIFY